MWGIHKGWLDTACFALGLGPCQCVIGVVLQLQGSCPCPVVHADTCGLKLRLNLTNSSKARCTCSSLHSRGAHVVGLNHGHGNQQRMQLWWHTSLSTRLCQCCLVALQPAAVAADLEGHAGLAAGQQLPAVVCAAGLWVCLHFWCNNPCYIIDRCCVINGCWSFLLQRKCTSRAVQDK